MTIDFKRNLLLIAIVTFACLTMVTPGKPQTYGENIVLGKTAHFSDTPNYMHTRDEQDHLQLTDGEFAGDGGVEKKENSTALWVQKRSVAWANVSPVVITFDLQRKQPISGALFSTAAGQADVKWPLAIHIAVSDDNKNWYVAGELVQLSRKNGTPARNGYARFRYKTNELKTQGRYIAFIVNATPYLVVDEIEVYAGQDSWLASPVSGESFSDLKRISVQNASVSGVQRRLHYDVEEVRKRLRTSRIPDKRKKQLHEKLARLEIAISEIDGVTSDFKAILPFNSVHRDIFSVYSEVLKAQSPSALIVWQQHRFSWLSPFSTPVTGTKPSINFSMLGNQFRSHALLLTNTEKEPLNVALRLNSSPTQAMPGWLRVDRVEWTDTHDGSVVLDALIPVKGNDGVYQVEVPAGMTRKLWLTVDSSKVSARNHQTALRVTGKNFATEVPFNVRISSVEMPRPRLSLTVWDYTNGNSHRAINPQNRESAIELMRSHFVDTTWGLKSVFPQPIAEDFDATGNLKKPLSFKVFDEWVERWKGARNYFVFLDVKETFAGEKMGTAAFERKAGNWFKAIAAHVEASGIRTEQIGLCFIDEPRTDTHQAIMAQWSKVLKSSVPSIQIFTNPVWMRPDQTKIQEAITQADIICPMVIRYHQGGATVKNYFENLRQQGKTLWFYQCEGPVRSFDPQLYYRYQAWQTFQIGGRGMGFWAFGDTSGAPTSWNEYATRRITYAPAFIDKDIVFNCIHWDAVREGVQDFEELSMLRDAIPASRDAHLKVEAEKVLREAVAAVTGVWSKNYSWQANKVNPDLADTHLTKVRTMLEKL